MVEIKNVALYPETHKMLSQLVSITGMKYKTLVDKLVKDEANRLGITMEDEKK